jgi:hypothetical protein
MLGISVAAPAVSKLGGFDIDHPIRRRPTREIAIYERNYPLR